MARNNAIYVKAWCSHDNPLGKVVTGTPNLTNEIWGRCFEGNMTSSNAILPSLLCHRKDKITSE